MTTNGNQNKQLDYDDLESGEDSFDSQIDAEIVTINQGGAQTINAGVVEITQGGAATINADSVQLTEGGAGLITAGKVVMENAQAAIVVADEVHCDDASAVLLVAKNVQGTVQTLLDARAAVLIGASLGVSLALVLWLLGRFNRTAAD